MLPCKTGKVKFATKQFCLDHIKSRKNGAKYCYLCECGAWHLTRKKPTELYETEIQTLKNQVAAQNEIIKICSKNNKVYTKEDELEIKKDTRVQKLQERLTEANKRISRLRDDNADLINKNYILQKKMEKEKKISWLQYQLGEKWFLLTLLAIVMGVVGVIWFDGGWVWGTLFGAIAMLLGIYGGVVQWLNYKKGKNT